MKLVSILLVFLCIHIIYGSSVINLTSDNFNEFLKTHDYVLVKFFAPWCGHCKALAPEYLKASEELGEKYFLAEVDCTKESEICNKYSVKGYPTIKFFDNPSSSVSDYDQARTKSSIINFMKKQTKPAIINVYELEELNQMIETPTSSMVIGFFSEDNPEDIALFNNLAKKLKNKFDFILTTSSHLSHFSQTGSNAILVVRSFDEPNIWYNPPYDIEDLVETLTAISFPLIGELSPANFKEYIDRALPLFYIFIDPKNEQQNQMVTNLRPLAKEYQTSLSFVTLDGIQFKAHGDNIGLKSTTPGIAIHIMPKNTKYVLFEEVNVENIQKFLDDYSNQRLTPTLKSEDIPETQDQAVFTLVGKNFNSEVYDRPQSYFVKFYAPWCGHCKSLAPKFEQLGLRMKEFSDEVVIAEIDYTQNDVENIEIRGFPTLFLFAKGNKDNPIRYEGNRETDDMETWLIDTLNLTPSKQEKEL